MLGILPGLRKVGVGVFYPRVLIAVTELFFEGKVSIMLVLFIVDRALGAIRIVG